MELSQGRFRILAICAVAGLMLVALVNLLEAGTGQSAAMIAYSQFLDELDQGHIRSVILTGHDIAGRRADATEFRSYAADDPDLVRELRQKRVAIVVREAPAAAPSLLATAAASLPLLLLGGVGLFLLRRSSAAVGLAGLGRSRARLRPPAHTSVTFDDVAGVDEARNSLQDIVDFLREPARFRRLGGRMPRGVLLVGPPGTGKTLLARAIAGEARVPFFTISGADFVEMYVGIGAARVRAMFQQARQAAPCIIFVDEIDAVGRRRGAGLGGGNDEREQTLNQLLVEMDGFDSEDGIVLIAATNRADILDPALLRPGRFDRQVAVDQPDVLGRTSILLVHLRPLPLAPDVDAAGIARRTPGLSGADLRNLVNEAALLAARRGHALVGMQELLDSTDTLTIGEQRHTRVMTATDRRLIAYREGGRAIVALLIVAADPVLKVTILTHGRSAGLVRQMPEEEQLSSSLEQLRARLAILLAGRASEQLVFGRDRITNGTVGDIEQATRLARQMVANWGLSDRLGAVACAPDNEGYAFAEPGAPSVASEIRALADAALAQAATVLRHHRRELDLLANALMERETMSGEDIRRLLDLPSRQITD